MPKEAFYAKGGIKVKNADGHLVPFRPKTKTDCIYDYQTGNCLTAELSSLETQIAEAAASGGIELMNAEPTESNTASLSEETLIGHLLPETWEFILDVKGDRYGIRGGIPLNYYSFRYGSNVAFNVDWGDGTVQTLKESDYGSQNYSASLHTYASEGRYRVRMTSRNWGAAVLYGSSYLMSFNKSTDSASLVNERESLYYFQTGLVEIVNELPHIIGMNYWTPHQYNSSSGMMYSSMVFREFLSLRTLLCSCKALQTVPETLFRQNDTKAIFKSVFNNCTSLVSVPQDIFRYNTAATDFSECFSYCTALEGFDIRIGSAVVENAENFCTRKEGVQRIVRVPSGSVTHQTFSALSETLGIQVIGE